MFWTTREHAVLGLTPADFDEQRQDWAVALARVYRARGDSVRMRAYADSARLAALGALHAAPDDPGILMTLAHAEAFRGQRDSALRIGERAAAIMPISRDGREGTELVILLAQLDVLVGRYDDAMTHLEALLAVPSYISGPWLRVDPIWTPLHGNRRFERLTADAAAQPH